MIIMMFCFFFSLSLSLLAVPRGSRTSDVCVTYCMLIFGRGDEFINFISTRPQSNNYQSRCVRSNHVQICQLITKILF